MNATDRDSAESMRSLLLTAKASPAVFRAALTAVSPNARDAWLDLVFGLEWIPEDDPALPRGCVPYLPCSVDALLQVADHAGVQASDVFVDVGSGVGRAATMIHLATGATAIGLEIQPDLVLAARELATRLSAERINIVEGDAMHTAGRMMIGTVFFLYCPFSGDRVEKVLADLEPIAQTRQIRICCVDLPLPARPWLELMAQPTAGLAIYRSTFQD